MDRTEEGLVNFLNVNAGTHRLPGGALSDSAGRIADLDELAKKLMAATSKEEQGQVYTELETILAKITSRYRSYVFVKDLH